MKTNLIAEFLGKRENRNVFEFVCPRCGADGELGIPEGERTLTPCPEACGALFIVNKGNGMYAWPTLVVVNDSSWWPNNTNDRDAGRAA